MLREVDTKATTETHFAPDPDVVTTVRLPRELHERLKVLAAAQHRTFSQQFRLALVEHLDAYEQPTEAAA
jgi:predicted DNA-binding protein